MKHHLVFALTIALSSLGPVILKGAPAPGDTLPILVLADKSNFGLYTAEILKAEGLNEFVLQPITEANFLFENLRNFDVVILTKAQITPHEAGRLTTYVQKGGNVIVFCPGKELEQLTGIRHVQGTVSQGYIRIDSADEMRSETLQFHGDALKYVLAGANQIAALYTDARSRTSFPAVVVHPFGKGQVISFTYNLPESIVYTRQGNKSWQGQERDGMPGVRHVDMFVGVQSEANWIDREKVHIPQADEQMRLLSRLVEYLAGTRIPLPRLWYFPPGCKALTILTCDGENTGASDFYEANINTELNLVKDKGGVMSVYLIDTGISSNTVNRWRMEGHEIAIHFDDTKNAAALTRENMNRVYDESIAAFLHAYDHEPQNFHLQSVRNHWITWVGWADQASIESEHGFHLDFNAYKWDNNPSIHRQNWIGGPGYYTGSGLPMKFAGADGAILDIYQSETEIVDEQLGTKEGIFFSYKKLLDRSMDEESYAVIAANFHPNANANIPYLDELMRVCDYSKKRGVPLWNGEKLLHFLQTRDNATIDSIGWRKDELTFQVNSKMKGESLSLMIPLEFKGKKLMSLKLENEIRKIVSMKVGGKTYAFITVNSGGSSRIIADFSPQ